MADRYGTRPAPISVVVDDIRRIGGRSDSRRDWAPTRNGTHARSPAAARGSRLSAWVPISPSTSVRPPALLTERTQVLRAFFAAGGGLIDSSPMYGSSEAAIGHCLQQLGTPAGLFPATKVWSWFTAQGDAQMRESRALWGIPRFDLMQVHNLLSWQTICRRSAATARRGWCDTSV